MRIPNRFGAAPLQIKDWLKNELIFSVFDWVTNSIKRKMFTGIVEEIGTVVSMQERDDLLLWNGERGKGWELIIKVQIALEGAYLGCSIAINGTCLTATAITGSNVAFGVAPETYVPLSIFPM
jgi:hypothetical protein